MGRTKTMRCGPLSVFANQKGFCDIEQHITFKKTYLWLRSEMICRNTLNGMAAYAAIPEGLALVQSWNICATSYTCAAYVTCMCKCLFSNMLQQFHHQHETFFCLSKGAYGGKQKSSVWGNVIYVAVNVRYQCDCQFF